MSHAHLAPHIDLGCISLLLGGKVATRRVLHVVSLSPRCVYFSAPSFSLAAPSLSLPQRAYHGLPSPFPSPGARIGLHSPFSRTRPSFTIVPLPSSPSLLFRTERISTTCCQGGERERSETSKSKTTTLPLSHTPSSISPRLLSRSHGGPSAPTPPQLGPLRLPPSPRVFVTLPLVVRLLRHPLLHRIPILGFKPLQQLLIRERLVQSRIVGGRRKKVYARLGEDGVDEGVAGEVGGRTTGAPAPAAGEEGFAVAV